MVWNSTPCFALGIPLAWSFPIEDLKILGSGEATNKSLRPQSSTSRASSWLSYYSSAPRHMCTRFFPASWTGIRKGTFLSASFPQLVRTRYGTDNAWFSLTRLQPQHHGNLLEELTGRRTAEPVRQYILRGHGVLASRWSLNHISRF